MIRTVAELLENIRLKEVEILNKQNIKHPPTIGRMYEGLTQDLLRKALPSNSKLKVVSGFIETESGELSRQIDCMLVLGEGVQIPYTDDFKYQGTQVIAVIEVKKNLYSDTLDSAYHNLLSAKKLSLKSLQEKYTTKKQFRDAFYNLVGEDPFSYELFDDMPVWKRQIYFALNDERLLPIRIVIGYQGFSSENSLRNAFINYLDSNIGDDGYGPTSFPNLIISGDFSLIKLNFMPYGIRLSNRQSIYELFGLYNLDPNSIPVSGENLWPLYASYPENPLLLLLELIWTRLEYDKEVDLFEKDLKLELIRPLVLAKARQVGDLAGWDYEFVPFTDEQLANLPTLLSWEPTEVNDVQAKIILELIDVDNETSGTGGLNIQDPQLIELYDVIQSITKMGVAVLEGTTLKLVTRQLKIAVLPNGKFLMGDDNEGMFARWLDTWSEDKS